MKMKPILPILFSIGAFCSCGISTQVNNALGKGSNSLFTPQLYILIFIIESTNSIYQQNYLPDGTPIFIQNIDTYFLIDEDYIFAFHVDSIQAVKTGNSINFNNKSIPLGKERFYIPDTIEIKVICRYSILDSLGNPGLSQCIRKDYTFIRFTEQSNNNYSACLQ